MADATLLASISNGVKTITLNRPHKRNALDPATICQLRDLLAETAAEAETRVVVINGAGGAFCSGADLKEGSIAAAQEDLLGLAYNPVIRSIRSMPKPVIAAVDGAATGYGCSLAMACDIRLASERARFALVFVRVGLMVDGGASYLLPRLIGMRAREYALTGDFISAPEAERLGLVNHIYPTADLERQTMNLATRLAAQAPLAMAATKQAMSFAEVNNLDDVLEHERVGQRTLFGTEDVREGVLSFIEKRSPVYRGR